MARKNETQLEQYRKLRKKRGRYLTVLIVLLLTLAILIGAVSFYGDHVGDFVILVEKDTQMSLTLCEKRDFIDGRTVLAPIGVKDQTNISYFDLPLDEKNHPDYEFEGETFHSFETAPGGDHSERKFNSYFAYTFYLKNTSKVEKSVDYTVSLSLRSVMKNVDEALRIMLIRNRDVLHKDENRWIFAKPERDAEGNRIMDGEHVTSTVWGESYTSTKYVSDSNIGTIMIRSLPAQKIDDYTVVLWLEGDDQDCNNAIKGGKVMLDMIFSIVS